MGSNPHKKKSVFGYILLWGNREVLRRSNFFRYDIPRQEYYETDFMDTRNGAVVEIGIGSPYDDTKGRTTTILEEDRIYYYASLGIHL